MATVRGTKVPKGAGVPTLVPDEENFAVAGPRLAGHHRFNASSRDNELDRLYHALAEVTAETHPRTARLLASSTRKVAQKVFEEGGEVALETVKHRTGGIVHESADLLYNLVVLWYRAGIHPDQVWSEMRARAAELGIAEKPPKDRHRDSTQPESDEM